METKTEEPYLIYAVDLCNIVEEFQGIFDT